MDNTCFVALEKVTKTFLNANLFVAYLNELIILGIVILEITPIITNKINTSATVNAFFIHEAV